MSQQNSNFKSYEAGEDLSSSQYYLVYLSAAETVSLSGANGKAIGILQNEPESGETAVVKVVGTSKFSGAEAVAVGKYVTSDANGQGEVVDAAGEHSVGVCVEATSAADDIGELVISLFTAHADDS